MKRLSFLVAFLLGLFLVIVPASLHQFGGLSGIEQAVAQPAQSPKKKSQPPPVPEREEAERPDQKPYDKLVKGTEKMAGLFTLYRSKKSGKLYAEIKPEQLNVNYLCSTTLESGIGESGIYSGLPIGDFLFYFRQVNGNLHFVVRNVNFRVRPGDPLQGSLNRSFSDSVLYSLPIRGTDPKRKTILVELGPLLLSDFPGLTPILSSVLSTPYSLDASKSYLGFAKAFPLNVELESIYNFSSFSSETSSPSLPDSRALTLRVRFSLSKLPENNGYRPRLADDRIGYFITAYQDFSNDNRREPFVRYINRWQLEKSDPTAPLSPPKQPIVFWIENTVPLEFRQVVREGVLMWNKAFEKIGFKDAIEVRQMPDKATWDPADVRYNTIRWFNSLDATFAMGPSRVNPLTGQILDADIIVDGSFVRYVKQQSRIFAADESSQDKTGLSQLANDQNLCSYRRIPSRLLSKENQTSTTAQPKKSFLSHLMQDHDLCYGMEAPNQFAAGSLGISFLQNATSNSAEMKQYVHQFMRGLIAHEVGHTLGLRHNFHGSAMLMPNQLNNTALTQSKGLVGSVMDYSPPNLAPKGMQQGDYFTTMVGPYDEWAIEYGYTPIAAAVTQAELRTLQKIAGRSPEPDLAYATDEDLVSFLDPEVNAFDLSGDMVTYAQWQLDNAREMWSRLDRRYPIKGESYSEARNVFDTIFSQYFNYASVLPQYIGGQSFNRAHAGDPGGRPPFEPVPLEKQREALAMLQKYIFDQNAFQFSPELLNKLAPSRWRHWGSNIPVMRLDYPIHDRVFLLQRIILADLLSNERLTRMRDNELKTQPGEALTLPELFDTLQDGIWQEVLHSNGQSKQFSSLRRALQREYMNTLIEMVLRTYTVPEDARSLAWYKLRQLRDVIGGALRQPDLDTYTKAHLEESRDRISKALDAQLQSQ